MARTTEFASVRLDGVVHQKQNSQAVTPPSTGDATPNRSHGNEAGMACDLKHLYQKEDERGRTTWTETYPDNLDEAAENEVTAKYAILVRNKKSFDSRKKLEIDSVVVQSPLLKVVLSKVLKDYPGVTPSLKRLVFQAPFNPFVHRWTEFTQSLNEQDDELTKAHLHLLYTTLETELRDVIAAKHDYIENNVITYEHLWTIFQPGATIYTQEWGRDVGSKFSQGSYIEHPKYGPCYSVHTQRVNWDGDKFGYETVQKVILAFGGTTPIASLNAFPLEFHPDEKIVRAKLLARGKLFEQYHGYHYKAYKGFALGKDMCGNIIKVTVDSRIIIDTFAYGKNNPNSLPYLASLKFQANSDLISISTTNNDDEPPTDLLAGKGAKRSSLEEDHLIHCTTVLKGYALKSKRWLSFFIDTVGEITFNTSAFTNLVLPTSQKELILSFAESQVKHKHDFDDVISGKGKGIIMLLSGGPGIGKTLTAESVAENMKVPLYMMSAGDLGVKSSEVESSLTTILEMVAKWNAVLLLDECDVFLEARSTHDLERNKIVSIFLRTLEYYEGILFLTTNRVKNMDPAFQSRIHVSLEYAALDKGARKRVWENFLERVEGCVVGGEDIERLAEVEMNGRQIKNILKTGQLLAKHKGVGLGYEHLETVLEVEKGRALIKGERDRLLMREAILFSFNIWGDLFPYV